MIGNFKQAFLNRQEPDSTKRMQAKNNVPKSVIRQLNRDLPDGFHYVFDRNQGHLVVQPTKATEKDAKITVKIDYKENGIPEGLSQQKALDYIYRTQKEVKPSEAYVEVDGKKLDLTKFNEDPITHDGKIVKESLVIMPQPFPPAFPVELSTKDKNGEITTVTLSVRRQPNDDMNRLCFANVDFPALKFQWIINEKRVSNGEVVGDITIQAEPKKAKSVGDAIKALRIFRGFAHGQLCIGGSQIKTIKQLEYNEEAFDGELAFLETLKKLEDIINVKFDPAAEYSNRDAKLLYELEESLINNKMLREIAPFMQFHLSNISVSEVSNSDNKLLGVYKNMEGKDNVTITFIQTVPFKLMGATFNLFEAVMMINMSVSGVEESKVGGVDISLSNDKTSGNPWLLFRQYAATDQAAKSIIEEYNGKG